jgi:hypothetical protein
MLFTVNLTRIFISTKNARGTGNGATFGCRPNSAATLLGIGYCCRAIVRFYLPLEPANSADPVWSIIRKLSDKIGEQLTTHVRSIADENPLLKGIIDRVGQTVSAQRH